MSNALSVHNAFLLSEGEARAIIDEMTQGIRDGWRVVAQQADLAPVHAQQLLGRVVLNPFCFVDYVSLHHSESEQVLQIDAENRGA